MLAFFKNMENLDYSSFEMFSPVRTYEPIRQGMRFRIGNPSAVEAVENPASVLV